MVKAFIKTALLGSVLFFGSQRTNAQVSVGIQIGAPPPPRVVAVLPPQPAPEFVWVEGYWYPVAHHYRWHEATGHVRPIRARDGSARATTVSATMAATGMATTAALTTTTTGNTTAIGTADAGTTATIMTTIMAVAVTTIATKASSRQRT